MTLAEKTNGDIRSSLNSLQFTRNIPSSISTDKDVPVGWKEVLTGLLIEPKSSLPQATLKTHILKIEGNGDYERLMQGQSETNPSVL